jgi:hypothetical protein
MPAHNEIQVQFLAISMGYGWIFEIHGVTQGLKQANISWPLSITGRSFELLAQLVKV